MVLILVQEALGSIVEQVDAAVVQRGQYPWTILVEGEALHSFAFGLELSLHHLFFFDT